MARKRERKQALKKQRRAKRLRKRSERFGDREPLFPACVRMSELLDELVRPYLEQADSRETYETTIAMGMTAWNVAILPENEREEMLSDVYERIAADTGLYQAERTYAVIKELIERKLELFPGIHRQILGYDLSELPDGDYYLNVASTWT